MPFPFSKSKAKSALSPEIASSSSRPLMYAQSDYAPSIAETTRTVDSTATSIIPSRADALNGKATDEVDVDNEPFQRLPHRLKVTGPGLHNDPSRVAYG